LALGGNDKEEETEDAKFLERASAASLAFNFAKA